MHTLFLVYSFYINIAIIDSRTVVDVYARELISKASIITECMANGRQ